MTRTAARLGRGALLLMGILAALPAAQAAEQPVEAPGDFRNGQSNSFGSIALTPYLSAGEGSVPVEARIVLHDLAALRDATNVLFAFNLKGDSAKVVLESLRTVSGQALVPTSTVVVDGGRQPQAHLAPADLLAVANGGRIDLILAGRIEAKANGQSHLGAMAMAFDEAWDVVPSADGPAQVYGFTMVMATGIGGGAMPFQGQGNTWLVFPVALLAFVVAVAGVLALRAARTLPAAPSAAGPAATLRPRADVRPTGASGVGGVAVFGGPESPLRLAPRSVIDDVPTGPRQGPILPPHPLFRSRPSPSTAGSPGLGVPVSPSPPVKAAPSAVYRQAVSRTPTRKGPQRQAGTRPKPKPKGTPKATRSLTSAPRRQASR
ncbi:MAG: hypothetical protein ACYC2H_04410 [Thermoplasmatota archaeon]